ncbi:condensation domain-containing protein [Catenulispora subtropica]|uniref:Condensation domain-containing protein n=1 Tax=Catenulispora subtropica TaxID=450798 RepID=A0ABP5D091_9ACTN
MTDLACREEVMLAFAGLSGGVDELTWGQRFVWDILQALAPANHYINVRLRVHLPTDATNARVLDALRALVREHEILRTRFTAEEDREPRQHCDQAGELPVHLCQTEPGGVRKVADAEEERLWREPFQHGHEWPLRVSVVAADGRPRQVVFVFSHLAVDAWGCGVLRARFLDLLRTGGATATASGWQPRARAEFERSAPAREITHRFGTHWRRFLDSAPQTAFPVSPEAGQSPLFPGVGLHSVALAAAVRALAARLRVGPAAVLVGAMSALIGIRSDTGAVPLLLATGNRFTATDAASVGTYYQAAPALIDLEAGSLAGTIRSADRASKLAYVRGQGDPREAARLLAETKIRRGVAVDLAATVNVVPEPAAAAAAGLGVREIREMTAATRISDLDGRDSEELKLYLHAKALRSRAVIELFCDSRYVSRSVARTFLAGLELVLIETLDAGDLDLRRVAELAGIRPLARPEDSVLIDGCWVAPDAVRRLLTSVPGTTAAQVFTTEADGAAARLVAYVVIDRPATPQQLHDALIRRLDGNLTMAPHWYVICHRAPARPGSRAEWRRQAVVDQGSGRIDTHPGA